MENFLITKENLQIFFQPNYFFNPYPGYENKFLIPFMVFFVILLAASFISYMIGKKNRKRLPKKMLWIKIYNWLFWTGFVGLSLLFLRYEGTPYFSMRALLFALLIVFLVWPIFILRFYFKKYKKMEKEQKEKEEREKYFRKK